MKKIWLWNLFSKPIGDSWDSSTATTAFADKDIVSKALEGEKRQIRVAFRNDTPSPLVLCWVDSEGGLHHFYELPSFAGVDKVTEYDHIETTFVGDAFCFGICDGDIVRAKKARKLNRIIGGYRPSKDCGDIHIVSVHEKQKHCFFQACMPIDQDDTKEYAVSVKHCPADPTPIDTTNKRYDDCLIGGWPCRVQQDWHGGDKKLENLWHDHMKSAIACLPAHAREALSRSTPFYINKSMCYGPKIAPITGRAMCFHPGAEWLEKMGMTTKKCGCVEVFAAKEYYNDYKLWGPGGVLLHELCHAYHYKMLKDGYENQDVKKCYDEAMKEGLYDEVKVHGSQGPKARAYACQNQMEYFAELSVAFLAGMKKEVEYNKWQPFNRSELKSFDPRAYRMLQRAWKLDLEDHHEEKTKGEGKGLFGLF